MVISRPTALSLRRSLGLVRLSNTKFYRAARCESDANHHFIGLLDELHREFPYYGARRLAVHLRRLGHFVNVKRVRRLMKLMGLRIHYPKRRTTTPSPHHKVYPYLLRGLAIDRPNQVWCSDITYIRVGNGYAYACAVMDWHSRCILGWEVSNTMDVGFCIRALDQAFRTAGCAPDIFNTDQGSQFTSHRFVSALQSRGVRVSMDGVGRWRDNVLIERFWRSLKYEAIYGMDTTDSLSGVRSTVDRWVRHYNGCRPHQSLNYRTPASVHADSSVLSVMRSHHRQDTPPNPFLNTA